MMGHVSGVTTQIQKEEPAAIKVHCLAHCLNLCMQGAAKNAIQFEMLWTISWNCRN